MTPPLPQRFLADLAAHTLAHQPDHTNDPPAKASRDVSAPTVDPMTVVRAATGHPTTDDARRILNDPWALNRLTTYWTNNPPDELLLAQSSPHLTQLLDVALRGGGAVTDSSVAALRIPARHREDYVLGAATAQAADVDEFPGGRLTRQRFDDGSTEVTVVITRHDLGRVNDVMRLTSTDNDLTVLIILLSGTTAGVHLVGRIQPDNDTVYDNLELTGPFPITSLTALDLAAVTIGVAWSGVDAVNAWDAAARATGDTDLAAAIDRGIDLS